MNDPNTYLTDGIIEAYCLGNLSPTLAAKVTAMANADPAVREEIELTLAILEQYPKSPEPRPMLKQRVLDYLDPFLQPEIIDLENPPPIHQFSDVNAWNSALSAVMPNTEERGVAARVLKETDDVVLSVVWLYTDLVEDQHADVEFRESFLILEGVCECDFEGKIVRFGVGDYFDIPPNTRHSIKNISEGLPHVKGLVQRRKAA